MLTSAQQTRWPAVVALIGTVWWLAMVIGLHLLNVDQYNPIGQAVSDLAYARLGFLLDIAFIALGFGTLTLAYGLLRSVAQVVGAPLFLAIAGVLLALSGVFQTDPPDGLKTTSGTIHNTIGLIAFILMVAVMFRFAWRFRRDPRWRSFALPTLIWAAVAADAAVLFPVLGASEFGIAQRIFILIWWSWLFVTALRLRIITAAQS